MSALIFLLALFSANRSLANPDPVPILTILDEDASSIPDCHEEGLESWVKVEVDFNAFENQETLLWPGEIVLERKLRIKGTEGSYSYTYESEGSGSIILTYTDSTGYDALDGTLDLGPNAFYTLENCGPDCHVLGKEGQAKQFPADPDYNTTESDTPLARMLSPELDRLLELGRQGGEAVITIELYYTPQFASVTSNIQSFFNNEVNLVNVGYQQTQIGARLQIHCIKEIDLPEPDSTSARIINFRDAASPISRLFNTADIAVLYTGTTVPTGVPNRVFCGRVLGVDSVNFNTPPIAWVAKNCPNTLAHEIGHMFGARHNREEDNTDLIYSDAHGYLINGGYHTIMAYSRGTHPTGVNYYSNIDWHLNGAAMGDSRSNNARVLRLNRFALGNLGNEASGCSGTGTTTTQTPPSGTCQNVDSAGDCCNWTLQGYCLNTHVDYMRNNCARTCAYCCADVSSTVDCQSWVDQGYCFHTYAEFMYCNCFKSCGYCH